MCEIYLQVLVAQHVDIQGTERTAALIAVSLSCFVTSPLISSSLRYEKVRKELRMDSTKAGGLE
jgi:uncharacterized protein (DUF2132 family)